MDVRNPESVAASDAIYAVKRERVTLVGAGYDRSGRPKITHPTVYTVAENGDDVRSFDTRREADEWIANQS